jgi:hypothetical protein
MTHTYSWSFKKRISRQERLLAKWAIKSLGIEPRRQNELNDKEELQALAESIKAVYYQDYKTAYSSNSNSTSTCKSNDDKEEEVIIDKSYFDHII